MAATLLDWLEEPGLGRYGETFAENDNDFDLLGDLDNSDLEKLRVVSLGHRKRLLRAIAESGADAAVAP
jgi:hypothetical protein